MSMLDLNSDGLRQAGDLLRSVGNTLDVDLAGEVSAAGNDEVSQAISQNLNERRRWLAEHIKAGRSQAFAAGDGLQASAASYEAEDAAAAARMGGHGQSSAAQAPSQVAPTESAPSDGPSIGAIPDISSRDGEELALALEAGSGPGSAGAAAVTIGKLAASAQAAAGQLLEVHARVLSAGEAALTAPVLGKLTNGIAWAESIAAHAAKLAEDHATYALSHTAVRTAVGSSQDYKATKAMLQQAMEANAATGGAFQGQVNALSSKLTAMQQAASDGMSGYQTTGQVVSTPPGGAPDPRMAPTGGGDRQQPDPGTGDPNATDPGDPEDKKKKSSKDDKSGGGKDSAGGGQDMISQVLGAPAKALESAGKANPLSSAGQALSQLGQGLKPPSGGSPLKPPQLPTHPSTGKGPGKGAGGGGSPIKTGGIGGGGAKISSAGLTSAAAATPSAPPIKPGAGVTSGTSGTSGSGMGMMPAGAGRKGESGGGPAVNSRDETPLPDVERSGRPGVVGAVTHSEPVVNKEAQNRVLDKLRDRKKETEG
ncbi:Fis family transcriptional regulator [Mycobacteroides abscessus subsp. abscessus]|uniref:PE domain-containing protein n=1 Tax=Mycobacteroides abscessus TaxID=36809 RepID=UPI000927CC43|nr:PE domain-containing protein [Mycobacteroides abscessus]SIJ21844.1 Fis family transcriptional regulator [Mycobacteroides abscessus subsp. abscessus]SLH38734.1 Fis family transcriptional regulator [Mycobacteroides abscessus subsp. abscessus]